MRLSTLAYYADFFTSAALVVLFVVLIALDTWEHHAEWVLVVVLGGAAWTLIEYLIHRWIYHHVPYFQELHDAHHAEPNAYIGAPPLLGIAIICVVSFAPLVSISFVVASGLTTGVLVGYCTYMLVHHADHYWRPATTTWLYRARHHHAQHHYHSGHSNFGITTSFWDRVFGTVVKSGRA